MRGLAKNMGFLGENLKTKHRSHGKNVRGQVSIFMAMMLLTFLLFFAFVMNVGMLVNAKINLQNAADLAAYAGAATQARQLSQIGMLNYEMRRQYKKFLFRYYVIGNMAQREFPRTGTAPPANIKYDWKPNSGSPFNFGGPVVCLTLRDRVPAGGAANTANDNYCAQNLLPKIGAPPPVPGDPISAILAQNLGRLEDARRQNCEAIGDVNRNVLSFWLYNTDPNFVSISNSYSNDPAMVDRLNAYKGIASGLGLVPKLLLINQRIKTLAADYINSPPVVGINARALQAMEADLDPAVYERTIQAYKSAFFTLGENTFLGDTITMDEIMPEKLIELGEIQTQFDAFAVEFEYKTTGCLSYLTPVMVPKTTIGVYKKPDSLTYYAVKLKAKARLLFSPFRDFKGIDLEAFAAAQPFGSRIGPDVNLIPNEFQETGASRMMGNGIPDFDPPCNRVGTPCSGDFPNLAFDAGKNMNWKNSFALHQYFQQLVASGGTGALQITANELARALKAATAPNPRESSFYLVANDLDANRGFPSDSSSVVGDDGDPFVKFFDNDHRVHRIFAPFAKGAGNYENVKEAIKTSIGNLNVEPPPGTVFDATKFKNALVTGISDYLDGIKNGGPGDGGEDLYFYQIGDPFFYNPPAPGLPAQAISLPQDLMIRSPISVRNSWNSFKDAPRAAAGRVGYSVKHVSFQALQNPQGLGLCTNPGGGACTSWTNFPTTAPGASPFLPFLSH